MPKSPVRYVIVHRPDREPAVFCRNALNGANAYIRAIAKDLDDEAVSDLDIVVLWANGHVYMSLYGLTCEDVLMSENLESHILRHLTLVSGAEKPDDLDDQKWDDLRVAFEGSGRAAEAREVLASCQIGA